MAEMYYYFLMVYLSKFLFYVENYIDHPGWMFHFFRGHFIDLQTYCWQLWFAGSFIFMAVYLLLVKKEVYSLLFFLFVLFGMLLFRLPSFMQYSYNPDESEFLSCINLLSKDLSFWKHADTHTSGPLDSIPFVLFAKIGIPLNYFNFRCVNAVFIQFPTLLILFNILRIIFSGKDSRILLFPFVLFYVFLSTNELIIYTSEQIPNLLLLISVYCFALYLVNMDRVAALLTAAFLLGMLPLAKFQYSIIAAFAMVVIACMLLQQKKYRLVLLSLLVAALPVLIATGMTLHNGSFGDAIISYVKMNLVISREGLGFGVPFPESLLNVYYLLEVNIEFKVIVFALSVLIAVQLYIDPAKLFTFPRVLSGTLVLLVISYFTIIKTGNLFYHYLYILFPGIAALMGYLFYLLNDNRRYKLFYCLLFVLLFAYSNFRNSYFIEDIYRKINHDYSPAAIYINTLKRPDTKMAVWGWNTRLYIETESCQAVRDPNTFNQTFNSEYSNYFIQRFIADMEHNRPFLFVDAVPGFYFRDEKYRYENNLLMKNYIQSHYRFLLEIDKTRIYKRID